MKSTLIVMALLIGFGTAWQAKSLSRRIAGFSPGVETDGGNEAFAAGDRTTGPSRTIRGMGYAEPASEIRRLTFKVDGVIRECRVHLGQRVRAGETLAVLHNREEDAAVRVAEQELALAEAERARIFSGVNPHQIEAARRRIDRLQAQVQHAQACLARREELRSRNAVAEEDYEHWNSEVSQLGVAVQEAEAELAAYLNFVRPEDRALADAKVGLAEARLRMAEERLHDTILAAPSDGTVLEVIKREGEAVRVFDPQPVLLFADDTRLRVRAEIDERYVAEVAVGQAAVIHGRGLGRRRYAAVVSQVKGLMGPKTVFSGAAGERKDLDVLEIFLDLNEAITAPIGLQVDVDLVPEVERPSGPRASAQPSQTSPRNSNPKEHP